MARPPKPIDPDWSALHWLGFELRRWRTLRRLSQKTLGSQIGFSRVYISLVETAQERPAQPFVERCDHALQTGGRLLAIYQHVTAEQAGTQLDVPALRAHASQSEAAGGSPLVPFGPSAQPRAVEWPTNLDRARQNALSLWAEDLGESMIDGEVAAASTAVALRWLVMARDASAAHIHGWRHVGMPDVERLRGVRRDLKTLDNTHGGGAAFPMAMAYLRRVVAPLLQGRYDDATGRALLAATAALKLDVGWMAYDAGDHALANRYMTHALRLAHATEDRLFGGRVVAAMSHQALHLDHVSLALDLARAARAGTERLATPKATAMFAAMEACAQARNGDVHGCEAALGAAERALSEASAGDADPDWLEFDEGGLWGHAARAYRDLRRSRKAEQHAVRSISLCHSDHGRTHAQRRAILATAHLQRGEVDAASAVGTLIVAAAWHLHSNHVYKEVAMLVGALSPSGTVAARDFVEQAHELLAARRVL